ncbi:MAG: hypothetical protein ACRCXB_25125 [Aeromonadaceae bacterium]
MAISVMDRETGQLLTGIDSLKQRFADVLSFPRGLLVGRRGYGADLMPLLDRNMDASFPMDAFVAISEAVNDKDSGLSDFKLSTMGITALASNHAEFVLVGLYVPTGEEVTVTGVSIGGN